MGRIKLRGLILLILTLLSIGALYDALIRAPIAQQEMTQAQLFDLIKQGRVTSIINEPDPSTGIRTLTGTYTKAVNTTSEIPGTGVGAFKVPVDLQLSPYLANEIQQAGYKGVIETRNNSNIVWPLVINLLPLTIFCGWFLFLLVCVTRILYKAAFGPRVT